MAVERSNNAFWRPVSRRNRRSSAEDSAITQTTPHPERMRGG